MNKKITFAALVTLGFASLAQAATYNVYITGSTAGRASVHNSIADTLLGETVTQDNAAINSAGRANFTGGTFGGDTYNVYCSWSGSATGVGALVNSSNVAFMSQISGGVLTPAVVDAATFNHTADIAYSDVFQSSTVHSAVTLVDDRTIVLPFKFFTSEGSPVTNVTPQQAQVLFQRGRLELNFFTGLAADIGKGVVTCGRDNGSGTRITTMAETGVGAFSTLKQYRPTLTGTNQAITGATTNSTAVVTHTALGTALVVNQPIRGTGIPAGAKVLTVNSTTQFTMTVSATLTGSPGDIRAGQNAATHVFLGDGGESSGGTVAGFVAATTEGLTQNSLTPCYYLGYMGLSDGVTALLNGAIECQYNGVTYSADNVRNGKYSLWGYLHQFTRDDVSTGASLLGANLILELAGDPGASGLANDETMLVERIADGANITLK